MARLIDGYAEGLIEKGEFEPRIKRMKQRVTILEDQLQQLADEAVQHRELRLLIGQLEEFVTKVQRNLATADWETKREIVRALVRRVEIDKQEVTVVFRVGPDLSGQRPEKQSSQHCWRRPDAPARHNTPQWLWSLAARGDMLLGLGGCDGAPRPRALAVPCYTDSWPRRICGRPRASETPGDDTSGDENTLWPCR
jgi:site-specific DNA recombinase